MAEHRKLLISKGWAEKRWAKKTGLLISNNSHAAALSSLAEHRKLLISKGWAEKRWAKKTGLLEWAEKRWAKKTGLLGWAEKRWAEKTGKNKGGGRKKVGEIPSYR